MLCLVTQRVQLFVNSWTVARQTPLSIGILQVRILECIACPPPGDLPSPGIEPRSPAFQANSLPAKPPWRPKSQLTRDLSILLISLKNTFLFHWCFLFLFLFPWFLLFIMYFLLFIFCLICSSFSNFLKRKLRLFIGDSFKTSR